MANNFVKGFGQMLGKKAPTMSQMKKRITTKKTRRAKSMITDDYGSQVVGGKLQKAQDRLKRMQDKRNTTQGKVNSVVNANVGRVKSVAGKAGLYNNTTGKMTDKGMKVAKGAAAVGVAGVGAAAYGAHKKRQEDKKFSNRLKRKFGM